MCNIVHRTIASTKNTHPLQVPTKWNPQFRVIKPEGYGWKVLRRELGTWRTVYTGHGYNFLPDGYATYTPNTSLHGFCFYKTRKEALIMIRELASDPWHDIHVQFLVPVRIHYKQGLGSFYSPERTGNINRMERFMIAKQFKIIQ